MSPLSKAKFKVESYSIDGTIGEKHKKFNVKGIKHTNHQIKTTEAQKTAAVITSPTAKIEIHSASPKKTAAAAINFSQP